MENQIENKKTFPVVIIFPIFLLIILIAVVLFINKNSSNNGEAVSTVASISPTSAAVSEKGTISLKIKDNKSKFGVGEAMILNVITDSNNSPITGYDIVVKYDPNVVNYLSQKSLLSDFQVYAQNEQGKLSLTGIKKIASTSNMVFQNTIVSELTFKVLKAGKANFEIEFVPGSKKESNLIDGKNNDVLGGVNGVEVTVN